jgi:hypothetical protein
MMEHPCWQFYYTRVCVCMNMGVSSSNFFGPVFILTNYYPVTIAEKKAGQFFPPS